MLWVSDLYFSSLITWLFSFCQRKTAMINCLLTVSWHILDISHHTLSCYYQRCWPVFTQDSTLCLSVSFYISIWLIMGIFYVAEAALHPLSRAQSIRCRNQLLLPTYNIWGYFVFRGLITQHVWDDHYPGCWPILVIARLYSPSFGASGIIISNMLSTQF